MEEAKLGRAISRAAAGEYGYCPTRARREMRAEFGPSRVEKLEERVEALEAALERLVLGTAACLQVVKVPQVMLDVDIEAEVHRVVGHRRLGRTSDARGSSGAVPTDNVPRRARYPHLLGDILGAVALAVLLIVSLYLPEVLEW